MIKLKKMRALIVKNLYNIDVYESNEILFVLCNAYKVSRNQDKFEFDINNYIN